MTMKLKVTLDLRWTGREMYAALARATGLPPGSFYARRHGQHNVVSTITCDDSPGLPGLSKSAAEPDLVLRPGKPPGPHDRRVVVRVAMPFAEVVLGTGWLEKKNPALGPAPVTAEEWAARWGDAAPAER